MQVNHSNLGTVLVTGAGGQIGMATRNLLKSRASRVICLSGGPVPLVDLDAHEEHVFWPYEASATMPHIGQSVDYVIHLGAQTGAYAARKSPLLSLQSNVVRFVALLEGLANEGNAPFVVLAGTATQAGTLGSYLTDDTIERPETFYDVSKSAAAMYLAQFGREGILSGVTLRFSNIYGALPMNSKDRGFLAQVAERALAGDDLQIFRGCDGRRDFLHVSDAAQSIVDAAEVSGALANSTYWVGSGDSLRLSQALDVVVAEAKKRTGKSSRILKVDDPPGLYAIESRDVVIDSSSFMRDTSWRPKISFEVGVRRLVDSILERT